MSDYIGFSFKAEPITSSHFLIFAIGFLWASNTGGNTVFHVALCNLQLQVSINLRGKRHLAYNTEFRGLSDATTCYDQLTE